MFGALFMIVSQLHYSRHSKYPQRTLLFEWKCLRKAVLVKKWLGPKIISRSTMCPTCDSKEETMEHIFSYVIEQFALALI